MKLKCEINKSLLEDEGVLETVTENKINSNSKALQEPFLKDNVNSEDAQARHKKITDNA